MARRKPGSNAVIGYGIVALVLWGGCSSMCAQKPTAAPTSPTAYVPTPTEAAKQAKQKADDDKFFAAKQAKDEAEAGTYTRQAAQEAAETKAAEEAQQGSNAPGIGAYAVDPYRHGGRRHPFSIRRSHHRK